MVCNKRTIESLIKAGAFDSLGHTRRGLMRVHEDAVDAVIDIKRNEAHGQDRPVRRPRRRAAARRCASCRRCPTGEWDKRTLLAFEREMLGLYVSDHPLLGRGAHPRPRRRHARSRALLADDGAPDGARSRSPG